MNSIFKRFERRVYSFLRREPPSTKPHRVAFWLLVAYLVLGPFRLAPGAAGYISIAISTLIMPTLVLVCIPLTWRWVFSRLLWKVRNRLIVTYLLMGLAPVLLLLTLGLIAVYLFAGQFASFAATAEMEKELSHMEARNRSFASQIAHAVAANPAAATTVNLPELVDPDPEHLRGGLRVAAFEDGRRLAVPGSDPIAASEPGSAPGSGPGGSGRLPADRAGADNAPLQAPGWAASGYKGMVFDGDWLYLRAVDSNIVAGHKVVVVSSLPLREDNVGEFAKGLGAITIFPRVGGDDGGPNSGSKQSGGRKAPKDDGGVEVEFGKPSNSAVRIDNEDAEGLAKRGRVINGGKLPPAAAFYDWTVEFYSPILARAWKDGSDHASFMHVESRPTLLYQRLVISSLKIAGVMEQILITIGIFFALLELVAFIMAMRLNQTITRSVRELYYATQQVDRGNFAHRIKVTRKDQLAALSSSFNQMTSSIEQLLQEQREKERLQNELAIAQEVQANLFPLGDISLPMLELHGVCRPARTVSGDYYDFLLFDETSLCIALGDISGKGISAALLMATLHSAVRAYRFAGEEMVTTGTEASYSTSLTHVETGYDPVECGDLFESPAKVLALLNRHLYRSTQPEKYATLFLAFYDGITSRLTYSNGGQLPPILLRRDGSSVRLDCGGTVVGLLDGMSYEQGTVTMKAGDILVAYSDGVTEPENEFGDFGEDRLVELVRRHQHLSLAAISDQVMQALRSWIGAEEQPDDITLVLARQL